MRNKGQKPWHFRRKIVIGSLLFSAFCILWTMLVAIPNAEAASAIITGSFGLAGAVVGYYVGAATWSDRQ